MIASYRASIEAVIEPVEAVRIAKEADAIAHLTKKADLGEKLQDAAAELVLRARRRAGELLATMPKNEGAKLKPGQSQPATALSGPPTLKEIGVSKSDSSRWQDMASLPVEDFESHIANAGRGRGRLTTSGVVRAAKAHTRENTVAAPDVDLPVGDVEGDRLSLRCGDFREVLAEIKPGSVDLIVCDPPWQDLTAYSDLGEMSARLLGPRGVAFVWSSGLLLPEVMERLGEHLTWGWMFALLHPGPGMAKVYGRHIFKAWRPVLAYTAGPWPCGKWGQDVLKCTKEKSLYEWQGSTKPAQYLIERYCPKDGVVLDPFMGVGSFGVAAQNTGRRFVGVELDAGRFNTSVQRLIGDVN